MANSMHVKKGDTVKVLSGKDKGKQGKVLRSVPEKQRVVVEKVNMAKKALRPTQQNPQGGIATVVQRDAGVPQVLHAHPRVPQARRERPQGARVQEVQQGHRLALADVLPWPSCRMRRGTRGQKSRV